MTQYDMRSNGRIYCYAVGLVTDDCVTGARVLGAEKVDTGFEKGSCYFPYFI